MPRRNEIMIGVAVAAAFADAMLVLSSRPSARVIVDCPEPWLR